MFLRDLLDRVSFRRVVERRNYSWMFPPETVEDAAAWDRYWGDQLSHGVASFSDMFIDDGQLVDTMRVNGLRSVLCVGNGVSLEPRALARAGFDVTALDLSPLAARVADEAALPDDVLARLTGGRRPPGRVGAFASVAGDLRDPFCCPGPYDVVIERRTLQLWPEVDRPAAAQAVANRLAARGIFFSHCHDGRWRPPAAPRHELSAWFMEQRWTPWQPDQPLTDRVVWLMTSTG